MIIMAVSVGLMVPRWRWRRWFVAASASICLPLLQSGDADNMDQASRGSRMSRHRSFFGKL